MKNTGTQFLHDTMYGQLSESDQEKGLPYPPVEKPFDESKLIALPDPSSISPQNDSLKQLIGQRTSVRRYDTQAISLDSLSFHLWATQGVKKVVKNKATFRTVPSAGARHALETYLLINHVEGLSSGLYRYIATQHALLPLDTEQNITERLTDACLGQKMVTTSAVTYFWSAEIYRMSYRYSERSYRYILLDAGHVCQNLYLAAESTNCGVCAIAAYDDNKVNQALTLDGKSNFVAYIATLGKKVSD